MWGFQSGPSLKNERNFGTKNNNKETYIFKGGGGLWEQPRSEKWNRRMYIFEKGVFRSGPGRKSRVFRSGLGRKMGGFRAAHTSTALIWEYSLHPHPLPRSQKHTMSIRRSLIKDVNSILGILFLIKNNPYIE